MLRAGKLENAELQAVVLDQIRRSRPEIKVGAGIGEDCAVVDFGDYDCVLSTDPITASVRDVGRLAIHVSCNDVASNGIQPLGILLTVMLPVGTSLEDVRTIMAQAVAAAEEAGVEIIGGHTEVTPAVRQPVIVSTALGRAPAGTSQQAAAVRPGDAVLMTKTAGLEGTGILVSEHEAALAAVLTAEERTHARDMLRQVSVVREGVAAGRVGTAGMHDVTEGGVLGAVWELCHLAGLGCQIREDRIPIDPVTAKVAAHYGIDPLRLISSGCMMILAPREKREALLAALAEADVPVSEIGVIREAADGVQMITRDGRAQEIAPPGADELYRVME